MRRESLPDGGHVKVILKTILGTLVETRHRDNVTPKCGGDVPQQRYWVFHLGVTGVVVETY